MVVVTLYEDGEGGLFLHLGGDRMLWCLNDRTASTFLTDAIVVANEDTASHPAIFCSHVPWEGTALEDPASTRIGDRLLRAIAALRLNPGMGDHGAAYTLFRR